jgi:hypothetical protein
MRLGRDALSDLRSAVAAEWLLANGLGGSASGTAAGAHARRTHAWLVAAEPHGRLTTLLLKLDERLHATGTTIELGCQLLADGTARPAGHLLLESFALDPWPTWVIRAGDVTLERSLFPISGHNGVAARYRHLDGPAARLTLSPVVVARDPGALQREHANPHAAAQVAPGRARLELEPGRPALTLWHNGAFLPARVWVHGVGDPAGGEDALIPGYIEATLAPGATLDVVAAAESDLFRVLASEGRLGDIPPRSLAECVTKLADAEREMLAARGRAAVAGADLTAREAAAAHAGEGAATPSTALLVASDGWTASLSSAVLSGLTRRAHRLTLVSALPGAAERGAETMRVLPALVTLRAFDIARELLQDAVEHLDEGLSPEGYDPVDGTPRHADPAPALWLIHAAELYARRGGDLEFVKRTLYPALEGVMQFFRGGTRHGIRVETDGLLAAGERGARRSDLNALWYHALVAMAQLARLTGRRESAAFSLAWAREHQARFNEVLWDEKRGALFDSLEGGKARPGLSPSQLLAVRLPPAILAPDRARRLVSTIERELFTPLGLRERPGEPRVHTAWLGPFYAAYLRAHQRAPEAQARVRAWLDPLRAVSERGVPGALPEGFEAPARGATEDGPAMCGDPVSVLAAAELLQVWIEDLDHAATEVAAPA